MKKGNIS